MSAVDRTKAPALAPLPEVKITPARELTLEGGARLTVVESGDQPLARLVLMWEGGVVDMERDAAAMMMTDTMLEGTAAMTGAAIADKVDYEGARLNSRGGEHYCGLSLLGLSDHIAPLLPVVRSVVTEPAFPAQSVEVIGRRNATASAVRLAKVSTRAANAAKELIAGKGNPAARVVMPEDFLKVTSDDLRDVYRRSIGRSRKGLHAFLGGRFSEGLVREVISFIERLPDGDGCPSPITIVPYKPETPQRVDIAMPEAVQSAVTIVLPAIGRDNDDYIPLRLTMMALGGYFGSRLMANIREERGLTYGITAHLMGATEGTMAQIDAQCSAENVEEVIEQTMKEISGLWERRPGAEELERLKLSAWSNLAAQADSPISALDYYVTRLLVRTPEDYFTRQIEAIRRLDADTIATMAKKYLSAGWSTVTCGPPAEL